jgi:hypothetical protein
VFARSWFLAYAASYGRSGETSIGRGRNQHQLTATRTNGRIFPRLVGIRVFARSWFLAYAASYGRSDGMAKARSQKPQQTPANPSNSRVVGVSARA